jgi:hypothetical protein
VTTSRQLDAAHAHSTTPSRSRRAMRSARRTIGRRPEPSHERRARPAQLRRRLPRLARVLAAWPAPSAAPPRQIALLHREVVDERHWISDRRFLHGLNFSAPSSRPAGAGRLATGSAGSCMA